MYLTVGSTAVAISTESLGFAETVPVLWGLNIVAAKNMVGDSRCPGF
jgi:hypothetical protein